MKSLLSIVLVLTFIALRGQAPATTNAFDEAIDSRFKSDEPGGVALVAKDGKIIYHRAFGMANLESNIPMKPDMIFSIGSMGKQFTAVSILQLMEQRKLKLSDPVSQYFTGCPASWQPITLEHLLTHTSGIADGSISVNEDKKVEFKDKPLNFTPGSKWAYSNTGFAMLGLILEKVSGLSYGEYLRKHIIGPLQLTHTYIGDEPQDIPDVAIPYLGSSGRYRGTPRRESVAGGGGGLLSTPSDMLKWTEALVAGKVIKKKTLAKAWTSYVLNNGSVSDYGYGWWTAWEIKGSAMVNHGGLAGGFTSDAVYLPDERIYAAVFLNIRGPLTDLITDDLVAAALEKPSDLITATLPDSELERYTGVYMDRDSSRIDVILEDHQLYYKRGNVQARKMITLANKDQLFVDNTLAICLFKRDDDRQVTGFRIANKRNLDAPGEMFEKTTLPLPGNQ